MGFYACFKILERRMVKEYSMEEWESLTERETWASWHDIMCLKSRVVMCPSVVSELVADGEQAINTSLFSTYVVSWSLIELLFRTWPLNWQIKPAFLLLIEFTLKKKKAKWLYLLLLSALNWDALLGGTF